MEISKYYILNKYSGFLKFTGTEKECTEWFRDNENSAWDDDLICLTKEEAEREGFFLS